MDHDSFANHPKESFFDVHGRLRRRNYWLRSVLIFIPAGYLFEPAMEADGTLVNFLYGILLLVTGALFVIQTIKRFQDMGNGKWNLIFLMIPILNVYISLRLYFKDGTVGPNPFGEDPKGREDPNQNQDNTERM